MKTNQTRQKHNFQIKMDENSEFIKNTKSVQHKPRNADSISN